MHYREAFKGLYVWMDGQLIPYEKASVHLMSITLHYGLGIFEGIRAYPTEKGGAIFRLDEHLERLFQSAHILQMEMPYSQTEIKEATLWVMQKNNLTNAYIRPVCYHDAEEFSPRADFKTHVGIIAWDMGKYVGGEDTDKGLRTKISSFTRHHVNSTMCKAKASSNYVNTIMAIREAMKAGYDEAIMLDHEGYVAEGSSENVFIVKKNVIYTPPATSALEGITRDSIIEIARNKNMEIHEKRITRDELYIADEAFLTATAAEVVAISEVDNRLIGDGKIGKITKALQTAYFDVVYGRDAKYQDWLTIV